MPSQTKGRLSVRSVRKHLIGLALFSAALHLLVVLCALACCERVTIYSIGCSFGQLYYKCVSGQGQ